MKDRVPLYKGRVKLVPVAGQENIYDMTRADSPQQEGTRLWKATLLTDETAAKIWPDESERPADPTPNEALAALVRPEKTAVGSYAGTGDLSGKLGFFTASSEFNYSNQTCILVVEDKIIKLVSTGYIGVSTDGGETYAFVAQLSQQDNQTWNSMCYGNGVYVAVSRNYYAWSEDLTTWTVTALSQPGGSNAYVAFGDSTFVISTQGGIFFYSDDGKTFTRTLSVVDYVGGKVIYADGKFVCMGYTYQAYSTNGAYSTDKGRTWQAAPISGLESGATGVRALALTYAKGGFFACGYDDRSTHNFYLLFSTDAKSWNVEHVIYSSSNLTAWRCLYYDEPTDVMYLFGTSSAVCYVSTVYSTVWFSKSIGSGGSYWDAVRYNDKILLAGYSSDDSGNHNVYLTPLVPLYFPTDFKPKFLLIYRQDAQPAYENDGRTVWQCLFVTSEQTSFHINTAYADDDSRYPTTTAVFKDDGVYIYNFYSINVQLTNGEGRPYTWFAVG